MRDRKRVLFVDDEPKVLDGLRRMLRPMCHEWDMSFSESGQEALDILARESFDVIVTDMRMPGMDGTELLKEVTKRYPQIMRIALSGQADKETILRTFGPIHQYLSKPCNAETLKSALDRAYLLSNVLADDTLRGLISQIQSLPSLPSVYNELVKEVQSPDASIERAGRIISRDVGMSAKILQLVNSAFFGLPRHISSPAEAVLLLGLDTVGFLVLSIHMFHQFEQTKLEGLSLNMLQNHSMAVGASAKRIAIAESAERKPIDHAFIAGLLHDMGKLVLAANLPEAYGSALALASKEALSLFEAECEIFGATHAEVGAYLSGLWGLPDSVIMAAAFHHTPMTSSDDKCNTLTAVHVANALVHETYPMRLGAASTIDDSYLAQLGLTERLPVWREICLEAMQEGPTDDRENSSRR